MKSKKDQALEIIDDSAKILAQETHNLVKSLTDKSINCDYFVSKYLEEFISRHILSTLQLAELSSNSQEEAYENGKVSYADVKNSIQLGIARAFEKAFMNYSGREEVSYYCEIKPMPEPQNKLPV